MSGYAALPVGRRVAPMPTPFLRGFPALIELENHHTRLSGCVHSTGHLWWNSRDLSIDKRLRNRSNSIAEQLVALPIIRWRFSPTRRSS
jgi:hypothetical protein